MQIDGSKGEKQTKPEKKILSSKNINNKLLGNERLLKTS